MMMMMMDTGHMANATPDLRLPSQPDRQTETICWNNSVLPTEGWLGRVDLGSSLRTEIVYLPEDGHLSRH